MYMGNDKGWLKLALRVGTSSSAKLPFRRNPHFAKCSPEW